MSEARRQADPDADFSRRNIPVERRELLAWAMFDFANSGYTTVVLTAVFNAYFVVTVAAGLGAGSATLAWTLSIAAANALVLLTAPFLGAFADRYAAKKKVLFWSSVGCALTTASLGTVGPGDVLAGALLIVLSCFFFSTGEDLIAAFLPEIATRENMGRVSGFGWALGYIGGLLILGLCMAAVSYGEAAGAPAETYVGWTMGIVALAYVLGATPTFLWLRERAHPEADPGDGILHGVTARLAETFHEARQREDFFRLLASITCYSAGVYTVVVLAAVYAQEQAGFSADETMQLLLVVNLAAAAGAAGFGYLQDRVGSVPALRLSLWIWVAAIVVALASSSKTGFWVAGHMIGFTMGASQSAGRALVGCFTPEGRQGEFFGLWGLAVKLAGIIGPAAYGLIGWVTDGNHQAGLGSTLVFFAGGLLLLAGVDEARGRRRAEADGAVIRG